MSKLKISFGVMLAGLLSVSTAFAADTVSNPFGANSNTHITAKTNKTSPTGCGSFPRTCGQMTSCEQAKQALRCGHTRLDRDKDGIPCETICGG